MLVHQGFQEDVHHVHQTLKILMDSLFPHISITYDTCPSNGLRVMDKMMDRLMDREERGGSPPRRRLDGGEGSDVDRV